MQHHVILTNYSIATHQKYLYIAILLASYAVGMNRPIGHTIESLSFL